MNENIQSVKDIIEYLDNVKNEQLEKTWRKVSEHCSAIFSTLMPGFQAKLDLHRPEEGIQ